MTARQLRPALERLEGEELAIALRTASEEVKKKVLSALPGRAAREVRGEMDRIGAVRLSDVESAQQKIVDIVRRLEDAGGLIITGRGADSELVV